MRTHFSIGTPEVLTEEEALKYAEIFQTVANGLMQRSAVRVMRSSTSRASQEPSAKRSNRDDTPW